MKTKIQLAPIKSMPKRELIDMVKIGEYKIIEKLCPQLMKVYSNELHKIEIVRVGK